MASHERAYLGYLTMGWMILLEATIPSIIFFSFSFDHVDIHFIINAGDVSIVPRFILIFSALLHSSENHTSS